MNRVERDGYPLPLPPTPDDWLLTRFDRDTRTLSRKTGISYLDYQFKGPGLERLILAFGENQVEILVDPDDWRFVYVALGDELVQLVNDATDEFTAALSFQEAKAMENEAKTSGPPHPKAAQFDKDKYDRSRNTGCKATATSKKAVSQSTTAKAKQMKAIDRAHKPAPAAAKSTNPPADANCTLVLEEGDDELQMTNRRTGEAT
jgi:putative transposase